MSANAPANQQRQPSAVPSFVLNTHIFLYRLTGGVIGGKAGGRLLLLLTNVGRKSGKTYTTPLQYLPDGETFLVAGTNGGSPVHPQWYLNLLAHPQTTVQVGRKIIPVTARTATAEERPRLWGLFTRFDYFAAYERKTAREIPVVILTPTA